MLYSLYLAKVKLIVIAETFLLVFVICVVYTILQQKRYFQESICLTIE